MTLNNFSRSMPVWAVDSPLVRRTDLATRIEGTDRAIAWYVSHLKAESGNARLYGIFMVPDADGSGAPYVVLDECRPKDVEGFVTEADVFLGMVGVLYPDREVNGRIPAVDALCEFQEELQAQLRERFPHPDWEELSQTHRPIRFHPKAWLLLRLHADAWDGDTVDNLGLNGYFRRVREELERTAGTEDVRIRRDRAVALSHADQLLAIKPFVDTTEPEEREALRATVLTLRAEALDLL